MADLPFDELRTHVSLDDVTLPHVTHPEHKAQLAVPLTDDRVSAEQQSLGPLLGPGQFGENHAHHEGLDHHSRDALQAHDENGRRTVVLREAVPVPCNRIEKL